ncbi:MAG TPA: sigma-70 family RNA polymerase sigma factor [Nitrososphaeraceae archaeon]|nr:sigma-70 family RNA polymerase sigma factor [Nitrososphaeraceae archaeon]
MLTEQEAQDLMIKLIDLRDQVKKGEDAKIRIELKKHEQICIEKFKYLVTMKTGRYKAFSNYEDLNQEGFEALIKSMNNYNPKKGSFFWWAHKYIDTRISRSANLHTTIRYPLKVAKASTPHKESVMPLLIEERYCPDKELEDSQLTHAIQNALSSLTKEQKDVVSLAYGFDGEKPMSINKICKKLNISRLSCIKMINSSLSLMKENIKV